MMNLYTKKALIHFLISLAAIILGLTIFILAANSISGFTEPAENEDAYAVAGRALAAVAGLFAVIIIGIIDAIFTSTTVYMFAYFSNKNAIRAIEQGGDTTTTPKVLKILSLIEMIIAAIIAIIGGLLVLLLFSFN